MQLLKDSILIEAHISRRMGDYGVQTLVLVFTLMSIVTIVLVVPTQTTHAEDAPSIKITIAKSTYQYCEKLSYVVSVSEVTGQIAIAHIIDQNQKSSQAIPIPIEMLENEINAPFPFERAIFPTGTYTINMTYAGAQSTASFDLVDNDNICIPAQIKQIASVWVTGTVSDGFVIDAIKKSVDPKLIEVPFDVDQDNIYNISIPQWVKIVTYWWIIDDVTDDEIANVFDYLIKTKIINANEVEKENMQSSQNDDT